MWIIKLLIGAAVIYAAIVALMYAAQTRMLFPAGLAAPPQAPLPAGAREIAAKSADGHRLAGIHIPPAQDGAAGTLILGFGGNAWNAAAMALYLHGLYPDRHVAAFHYRGYAPSEGAPSAAALIADAAIVHDAAVAAIAPERVVAAGFSIGAGVAVQLATERPLAGLILVTPFDSLTRLASGHYPWAPVSLLLRHRMEPAAALGTLDVPVAIIAAGGDTIVPAARTAPLRAAAKNLVLDRTIAAAGHNSLYDAAAFREAMAEALGIMETGEAVD